MSIRPLASFLTNPPPAVIASPRAEQGVSFADVLKGTMQEVNHLQFDADQKTAELVLGKVDLHQAMISTEKASLALDMTIQIRNKLVEAYQELMRMQV